MGTVVLEKLGDEASLILRSCADAMPDLAFDIDPSTGQVLERLRTADHRIDAIVLGSLLEQPMQVAEQVHSVDPDLSIVIVGAAERLDQIRHESRLSPFPVRTVAYCASGDGPALSHGVVDAVTRTRQRRHYRATVSATRAKVESFGQLPPRPAQILDQLMDLAPVGVVVADGDLTVTAMNRRASRILDAGTRPTSAVTLPGYLPESQRERFSRLILDCASSDESRPPAVFETTRADGRPRFLEVTAAAMPAEDGSRSIMVILLDVTERELATAGLRRTRDGLEAHVQERTAELNRLYRELEGATAKLEESNQELAQFAYVASHDLQEPLRMVGSYCQLLQRRYHGQLDEKADEFIAYAVDGAQRMQRLISDLLALSRVESRGKDLVPTDLKEVVRLALENLQVTVRESGARVTVGALPEVMGDDTQLLQVFQNLIGNAIKFRSDREPVVHVSAQRAEDAWEVMVRDNGIGIDAEHADRIFEVFRRLHGRDHYEGTGIGLAVCKKMVERHGGRIWVESVSGEGSAFHFTLPVAEGTGL
ncbi:MAG: ATP-binding protein [Phycisphaerae bacterium]|nr:ATP-binding protein [Phycisphaerae bacterium]